MGQARAWNAESQTGVPTNTTRVEKVGEVAARGVGENIQAEGALEGLFDHHACNSEERGGRHEEIISLDFKVLDKRPPGLA